MALFGWFKKKPVSEIVEKIDEETSLKREVAKERAAVQRERMKAELEQIRLERAQRAAELQDRIDEERDERYLRKLERQDRIQELEAKVYGDDEEDENQDGSPESMLFSFLNKVMSKQQQQPARLQFAIDVPTTQSPPAVEEPPAVAVSPQHIDQMWAELPPQYKQAAKQMSDDDLRTYIIGQIPNIDQQSLDYAVSVVRNN